MKWWFIVLLLLVGAVALMVRVFFRSERACKSVAMDGPRRLLGLAAQLMPTQRRDWGRAMLAELDEVQGWKARWRFAVNCTFVALFPPRSPSTLRTIGEAPLLTPSLAIRGALGIATVWGCVWMAVAMVVLTVIWIVDPPSIDTGEQPHQVAPWVWLVGFACGIVFASILLVWERRRLLDDLSLLRTSILGALVGAAFPMVMGKDPVNTLIVSVLGMVSAFTSGLIVRAWAQRRMGRQST